MSISGIPLGAWLSIGSNLLVIILGFFRYKQLSQELRILLYLFVITMLTNVVSMATILLKLFINNIVILHFYTIIEYTLIVFVLSYWQKNPLFRQILRWSILGYFIIWIIAKLYFEGFKDYDNYTASLSSIIIIGAAVFTLYKVSWENKKIFYKDPRFWIISAMLVYFTGNLMWIGLSNIMLSWQESQLILAWSVHWGLAIFTNLLYAGGFLCQSRQ